MKVLRKKLVSLLVVWMLIMPFQSFANDPNCTCDELNDGTPEGTLNFLDCQDMGCIGYFNAPVTDHLWVLVLLGGGVAAYYLFQRKYTVA